MMKKLYKILFISLFFLGWLNVFASTNTFTRTEENLLVPDYITVTDANKNAILNTPAVDASEKIYDFANLYSDSEEQELYNKVMNYADNYNSELVIVTIDSNNKESAKEYAQDFYDYNAFGAGEDNTGVLFLIDMDTREIYMTTTGKAIDTYADSDIDIALDKVYSYMSNGEYYKGTSRYIDIISYSGSSIYDDYNNIDKSVEESIKDNLSVILIGSIIITVIVMWILISKNRLVRKAVTATDSLIQDKKEVNLVDDKFLGVHVSKVPRNTDSGSGGRGGSSISHGSSGISHGGGGHKF